MIAHEHKRIRVHSLTSAELRFLLQGAAPGKGRKMSFFVEIEDKILNKKRIVGEKRKFILQTSY